MASLSLLPEKFQTGDFPAWLRTFECYANANKWSAEDKLTTLPAFLRGPSAAHVHGLTRGPKREFCQPHQAPKGCPLPLHRQGEILPCI